MAQTRTGATPTKEEEKPEGTNWARAEASNFIVKSVFLNAGIMGPAAVRVMTDSRVAPKTWEYTPLCRRPDKLDRNVLTVTAPAYLFNATRMTVTTMFDGTAKDDLAHWRGVRSLATITAMAALGCGTKR